jgi:hypothetical protein
MGVKMVERMAFLMDSHLGLKMGQKLDWLRDWQMDLKMVERMAFLMDSHLDLMKACLMAIHLD